MNQTQETEKISALEQSVALLTELIARGEQRHAAVVSGEPNKSAALLEHERLTARVALAEHAPKMPPADGENFVTITLKRMHHSERDPDWNQAWVGVTFHDPISDTYCVADINCEIPTFLEAKYWQGQFGKEAADLGRLMAKGIVTVKPGVVIESKIVAVEFGQACAFAYMNAAPGRARISEDDLLRTAKLVDPFDAKLSKDLRSLAAGVAVQPSAFGLTGDIETIDDTDTDS